MTKKNLSLCYVILSCLNLNTCLAVYGCLTSFVMLKVNVLLHIVTKSSHIYFLVA